MSNPNNTQSILPPQKIHDEGGEWHIHALEYACYYNQTGSIASAILRDDFPALDFGHHGGNCPKRVRLYLKGFNRRQRRAAICVFCGVLARAEREVFEANRHLSEEQLFDERARVTVEYERSDSAGEPRTQLVDLSSWREVAQKTDPDSQMWRAFYR